MTVSLYMHSIDRMVLERQCDRLIGASVKEIKFIGNNVDCNTESRLRIL